MTEKTFVWTPKRTHRFLELRFQNDWLFKKKKQPWAEFREIMLQDGFPEEMSVKHIRKKWGYTYDMYRIAKRNKNKVWKYYKIFDKNFSTSKTLDKYDSWSDEWRLKLVTCISETKGLKLDFHTMWRTIEKAMRCQDLPLDCCIQDMKGLWQHIRVTFNRKHRQKLKKGAEFTEWPLYDVMLEYFKNYETDYLMNLENEPAYVFFCRQRDSMKYRKKRKGANTDDNDNENEFHWSKHITESFIQIRLQNDWLFRERKCAWSELLKIMLNEYGFPATLTSREICRKWASMFSEYQKARATNNKLWVYYNLFELYLGDGNLSLNPLLGWQEEWVFNLINARIDLEKSFQNYSKHPVKAWREVEKRLRSMGLPADHSVLDLPEIWKHLLNTFKWKKKFAEKGILNEQWPYYDAMARFDDIREKRPINKHKEEIHSDEGDHNVDDHEDDIKLFDLKRRLEFKPKNEFGNHCRACLTEDGSVDIYERKDDNGFDLAFKLKAVGGIEVERTDQLPSQICYNCLQELENAFKFRLKCRSTDKQLRITVIKKEILQNSEEYRVDDNDMGGRDVSDCDDTKGDLDGGEASVAFDVFPSNRTKTKTILKKERKMIRKKKIRKLRKTYDYSKICEICGKHTRNLASHLDAHNVGKKYSCDVCDKKFKFKSGLLIHRAVHDPTPKKTCEVCGKTFHILAQYRKHFVYHANERKFECHTCGKRFNTNDILKVHSRMHTDERPFSCQECGKTFRTAGCVSRHRRIVHRNVKQKPK